MMLKFDLPHTNAVWHVFLSWTHYHKLRCLNSINLLFYNSVRSLTGDHQAAIKVLAVCIPFRGFQVRNGFLAFLRVLWASTFLSMASFIFETINVGSVYFFLHRVSPWALMERVWIFKDSVIRLHPLGQSGPMSPSQGSLLLITSKIPFAT